MTRTPIETSKLSPAAQRALGSGQGKMMAARGLMPLAPADQVAVLYQLALDADQSLVGQARATAGQLPDKLLSNTLTDPRVDPRTLDFFAELVLGRKEVVDAIVLNPIVGDETLAMVAGKGTAHDVDLIAQNEQRLLRYPEIIAAMYLNRNARMSTVDRVVELAVRNNVRVPGLAAWEEIARSLQGTRKYTDADDAFIAKATTDDDRRLVVGSGEEVLEEGDQEPEVDKKDTDEINLATKIRAATMGNAQTRALYIRSPIKLLAVAAVKAPGVTEIEVVRWASNANLVEDVIRHIAGKRDWTKMYGVKVSLCRNPKTPMTEAMRFMPFLREKDLRTLSRSRGIPSAVVASARKLLMQRSGKT